MKKVALIFGGLLLSAMVCGSATAETVRVQLTARIVEVTDSQGQLNGKIVVGQRVNGTYVYNTNTPNQSGSPDFGSYRPYANEARMRFASGSWVFETTQSAQGMAIFVNPHTSGNGQFIINSSENKPLSNGVSVDYIDLRFEGVGALTESAALPTGAPDLQVPFQGYYVRELQISGGGFNLRAVVEAAELIDGVAFEVSPAAGTFLPSQHFDAALTLPANSNVATAQAFANGVPLPLSYPGLCQLLPPNSAGKPSLLCPNAEAILSPGGAPIDWTVVLTNGKTLTESVSWVLAQ